MIPALLADTVATVVVADHAEVRSRVVQGSDPGFDLTTTPSGRFEVRGRAVGFSASYEPRLTLSNLQQKGFATPEALQGWSMGMGWRTRTVVVALRQAGSYGDQNYTYLVQPTALPGQAIPPPQLLPGQAGSLRFGSSHTALTTVAAVGRRGLLAMTSSVYVGGGADELAKELIPLQLTPREDVMFEYRLTRRDRLQTTVGAQAATFFTRVCDLTTGGARPAFVPSTNKREEYRSRWVGVCRSDAEQGDFAETWRRTLGRRTELALTAGGAIVRSYVEGEGVQVFAIAPSRTRFYPVVGAELVHRLALARPDASRFEASARLAPVIDSRLGTVDPRLMFSVRNVTRALAHAKITSEVSFSQTVPPDDRRAASLLLWTGEFSWALSKRFDAGVALRGAWQQQTAHSSFVTAQGALFLEYHEPTIRLWP